MTKTPKNRRKKPPHTALIDPKITTKSPSDLEKAHGTPVEKAQNALTRQKAQKSHTQKHQEKRKEQHLRLRPHSHTLTSIHSAPTNRPALRLPHLSPLSLLCPTLMGVSPFTVRVCPYLPLLFCASSMCVPCFCLSVPCVCWFLSLYVVFVSLFGCAGSVCFFSCVLVFWFLL